MSSKVEQIVDHFTSDPTAKAEIMRVIADIKSGSKRNMEEVVAHFTTDDAIQDKIQEIFEKMKAGHDVHSVTAYHHPDPLKATDARNTILKHQGAVDHILAT